MNYQVSGIPEKVIDKVRSTLKSPQYGHPAYIETATGYGPCRSCLRVFEEGKDRRILFTYNPFYGTDGVPAPGPIFIHEESCARYEADQFPESLVHLPLFLECYGEEGWILTRVKLEAGNADQAIKNALQDKSIRYIHVRNAEAGCFVARIERR